MNNQKINIRSPWDFGKNLSEESQKEKLLYDQFELKKPASYRVLHTALWGISNIILLSPLFENLPSYKGKLRSFLGTFLISQFFIGYSTGVLNRIYNIKPNPYYPNEAIPRLDRRLLCDFSIT